MNAQVISVATRIKETVDRVLLERCVTWRDREQIKSAILGSPLSETEHILLDRILYGVRKGLLRIKD